MLFLEWKERAFIEKVNSRCFCWLSGGHIGAPKRCTNMASPYKGLQRCVNVSANNSETVGHKDLRIGQSVWKLVFYNVSFSWLLPPDGFQFIFCCVTVKTIYIIAVIQSLIQLVTHLVSPFNWFHSARSAYQSVYQKVDWSNSQPASQWTRQLMRWLIG